MTVLDVLLVFIGGYVTARVSEYMKEGETNG